jgi:hypothetical protein
MQRMKALYRVGVYCKLADAPVRRRDTVLDF